MCIRDRALTPRTKVVVCVSPSNPTGRTLSATDLSAMAAALEGTGAYLLSDEIYRDIYFTAERPASASAFYDRTIVISGLSKSCLLYTSDAADERSSVDLGGRR